MAFLGLRKIARRFSRARRTSELVSRVLSTHPQLRSEKRALAKGLSSANPKAVEFALSHSKLFDARNSTRFLESVSVAHKMLERARTGGYDARALARHLEESYSPQHVRELSEGLHLVFREGTRKGDLEQRLAFVKKPPIDLNAWLDRRKIALSVPQRLRILSKEFDRIKRGGGLARYAFRETLQERRQKLLDAYITESSLKRALRDDSDMSSYGLTSEMLVGVHLTKYIPRNGVIVPTGRFREDAPRETIHFALNGTVTPVNGGSHSWDDRRIAVVVPVEYMRGWITNLHPCDTFGYGKLRLPPGSKVIVEKSIAEREGLSHGQKLGHAEVVVVDEKDFRTEKGRYPPFHEAVRQKIKEMGFPLADVSDQNWIYSERFRDGRLMEALFKRTPFGKNNLGTGMTYSTHSGAISQSRIGNEAEVAHLPIYISDLKRGELSGHKLDERHLKHVHEFWPIDFFPTELGLDAKDINVVKSLQRIYRQGSEEYRREIDALEKRIEEGKKNGLNQRDLRRLKANLKIMIRTYEYSLKAREEINRLRQKHGLKPL